MMMMMSERSRSIFTATQWQELDNQTQIFRYMVSGVPIPPDLLFHVKRSLESSRLFHYQQPIGWGCFQVGFGRKLDPEPGRCRRTDGKKWRCSKEAFPDSKYCERHMHRGRNRSRKPVEILTAAAEPIPSTNKTTNSYYSLSPSMAAETHYPHQNTTTLYPFLCPNSLSSRPQPGIGFSTQNNNTHLVLNSSSSSQPQKDYRYFHGLEEVEDNNSSLFMNPFFPDTKKQKSYSELQHGYNQLQLQNQTDHSRDQQKHQNQKEQHCFVLGTDFNSKSPIKMENEEHKQPLRHFFDVWPLENKDSWMDLEDNRSNQAYFSNTQLSISIPMPPTDLNTRIQNDD